MSESKSLDSFDRAILQELQANGRISNQELAERVSLSPAPCWRRVRRLEDEGFVQQYTALLSPQKLALHTMAYVHISLINHHQDSLAELDQFIHESPEVLECYSVSGQYDYLLRVLIQDTQAFEIFLMKKLLQLKSVKSTHTDFVLRQKKYTTALPLGN